MHKSPFKRRGFSLIEIVIAVAIFAFSILVIVGLMGSSLKVTRDSEERIQAANLAMAITGRYETMLASEAKGQPVNWDTPNSPFPKTVDSSSVTDFKAPAKGRFVDALGNVTADEQDGVFGIKSIVWKEPWNTQTGSMLVHCAVQLEWPVAAAAKSGSTNANKTTNTYVTTTAFVITP